MTSRFKPTDAQNQVVDAFLAGDNVKVIAGAGCAKSTTTYMACEKTKKRGLFIAFNRNVADEAGRRLEHTNTNATNTHRLAYSWATTHSPRLLEKMHYPHPSVRDIAQMFNIAPSYMEKADGELMNLSAEDTTVLSLLSFEKFLRTVDEEPGYVHLNLPKHLQDSYGEAEEVIVDAMQAFYKDLMSDDGVLPSTHDAYLRLWSMSEPRIPAEFIALDEASDTSLAVWNVLRKQDTQLLVVGDSQQRLYEFADTIDLVDIDFNAVECILDESFRFGPNIADAANVFLAQLHAPYRLQGKGGPDRVRIAAEGPSEAILARTLAGSLSAALGALEDGQRPQLMGNKVEMMNYWKALHRIHEGKTADHPDLIGISSWDALMEHLKTGLASREVATLAKYIGKGDLKPILDEQYPNVMVSTIHKAKGREWKSVRLADDVAARSYKDAMSNTELMTYYVAVTRGKEDVNINARLAQYLPELNALDGLSSYHFSPQDRMALKLKGIQTEEEFSAFLHSMLNKS